MQRTAAALERTVRKCPRTRVISGALAALAVLAGGRAARADAPPAAATLAYKAPPAGCPDEGSFRDLVAARLGYDAFAASAVGARHAVGVEIARAGGALTGRATVRRPGESAAGERTIAGRPDRCEELAAALATAVAIALDPVRGAAPAPPPPAASSAPAPAPPPPAPPPPAPAPPAPAAPPAVPPAEPARVVWFGRAAAVGSIGATPGAALGGEAAIGARVRAFSLEATGRAETTPDATTVDANARVEATLFTAGLAACGHVAGFVACALGRAGALQGRAPDVANPSLGSSLHAAIALRAGYDVELARAFFLRAELEGGAPLVRTALLVDRAIVWTAPPVFGGAAIGLVVAP